MAVVSTSITERGIKAEMMQRLGEAQQSTHYEELSTRLPSNIGTERYAFLGQVPKMREWGTGRKAKGLHSESYDVENLKYEVTLEVDRDEQDDDQHGQIMIRVHELAERAARHKDYLIAQLLINGHSAGFHSYDGVPFFNAAHVSGDSGNQDNDLAPTAVSATAPTAAEFRTALGTAIATMLGFVDDQGEPMSMTASGLAIVVPPSMLITASEALAATVATGGQNVLSGAAKIIAFPWLTAASTWYLLKTDVSVRPFIFQDRMPLEFKALTEDSETGFLREKFLYGLRARYRMTYGYWQFAVRNVFTAS